MYVADAALPFDRRKGLADQILSKAFIEDVDRWSWFGADLRYIL